MSLVTPTTPAIVHPAATGEHYWLLGDLYTIKCRTDQTQGRMSIIEATIWPGHGSPPHTHDREDESFYILEGEFEILVEDHTVRAGPGDFVHLPAGGVHYYKDVGPTPGGFEQMFIDLGTRADQSTNPPPFDDADIQTLVEAAPRYGLRLV